MKTFSELLAICAGNSLVTSEFPAQRPVTWRFDIFFLQLNEWLSKKSWGWWFEMPSHPLWRHSNVMILISVPLGDKDRCITHCCWMPGDTGHQGISSHCIDLHYLEYLSFSTIRAYSSPPGQNGQHFRRHFQIHFLERKCKNVDQNLTEICS